MMSVQTWIELLLVFAAVGAGIWRWKAVNRQLLDDERCEVLCDAVVEDLFQSIPGVESPVRVDANYWRQGDLSNDEAVYLCRWMVSRGLVRSPEGWGVLSVILASPPRELALTQKSWSLVMNNLQRPNISIGDGNGPINIDGQQTNISAQNLAADELWALAEALRNDARSLPEPDATAAQAAAQSLDGVASGEISNSSLEAVGALAWVQKRASEAVGAAGGSALWAATVAAGHALGWFS